MTTTKITNVLKVSEFAEFADNLRSSIKFSNDWNRCIDFLQTQTQAKQDKFWKFYDEQTKEISCSQHSICVSSDSALPECKCWCAECKDFFREMKKNYGVTFTN